LHKKHFLLLPLWRRHQNHHYALTCRRPFLKTFEIEDYQIFVHQLMKRKRDNICDSFHHQHLFEFVTHFGVFRQYFRQLNNRMFVESEWYEKLPLSCTMSIVIFSVRSSMIFSLFFYEDKFLTFRRSTREQSWTSSCWNLRQF
jgi:hypothetical protein